MNERDAEVIGVYAGHCLVKCANVVLSSRVFSLPRVAPDERAKKWFSLAVEEVEPATKELAQWRNGPRQPLLIEIILRPKLASQGSETETPPAQEDVLLERWSLAYDTSCASADSLSSSTSFTAVNEVRMDKHSVYKKMVILTRSLYSYLRILPAYRLFRAGQNAEMRSYDLIYQITSGEVSSLHPTADGAKFHDFKFSDLKTPSGSLSIQVQYRPAASIRVPEETVQPQALPRIISDYINTPRNLQSLSASVHKAPAIASTGPSPSGASGGPQPPVLHRNSWSSKDVPNLLPFSSPYAATSSQIAASPKPSTMNGQRHTSTRAPNRTTSAPVHQERKASLGGRYAARSTSLKEEMSRCSLSHLSPRGLLPPGVDPKLAVKDTSAPALAPAAPGIPGDGRKVSAPVTIPRHRGRRNGSCSDMSMTANVVAVDEGFQVLGTSCPASAPANVPPFNGIPKSPTSRRASQHHPTPASLLVSGSDSSYSSACPRSCSPQLPFAFTPSGQSSAGDHVGFGSSASNLSPPISGRDISAFAVIRRPSWSSRSFDMNNPRFSDPSDQWFSPCNQQLSALAIQINATPENSARPSPSSKLLQSGGSDSRSCSTLQQSDVFHSCVVDSSESDLLPFALDGEGPAVPDGSGEGGIGVNIGGGGASITEGSSSQSDAAVVSFLRLMQEAPPLSSPGTSPGMSVGRAKEQLKELKVKVEGFKLGMSSPRGQ